MRRRSTKKLRAGKNSHQERVRRIYDEPSLLGLKLGEILDREMGPELKKRGAVLRRHDKSQTDFPAVEILDTQGREHLLTTVDFSSPNLVKDGSCLRIFLKERVVGAELIWP